jgi:hypothetical protein
MTAEIYAEFLRTLAIAWACFAMGAALWHWRAWATFAGLQHCSKLLLLLSPVLLSAFGYRSTEAVRTAELLAQQPRARSVFDEAPQLVAEFDCVTTPGGYTIEFTRTRTRTGAEADRRVQVVPRRSGIDGASDRQSYHDPGIAGAGVVEVPEWGSLARHGNGWAK